MLAAPHPPSARRAAALHSLFLSPAVVPLCHIPLSGQSLPCALGYPPAGIWFELMPQIKEIVAKYKLKARRGLAFPTSHLLRRHHKVIQDRCGLTCAAGSLLARRGAGGAHPHAHRLRERSGRLVRPTAVSLFSPPTPPNLETLTRVHGPILTRRQTVSVKSLDLCREFSTVTTLNLGGGYKARPTHHTLPSPTDTRPHPEYADCSPSRRATALAGCPHVVREGHRARHRRAAGEGCL